MSSRKDIAYIGHYTWTLLFIGIMISLFNVVVIVWLVIQHEQGIATFMLLIMAIGMGPYFLIVCKNKEY